MDVIAPSDAPIPNQMPGASLRAGILWFSWMARTSFFPMRQQQTGMYWQTFILTEIMTKHPGKVGDRHAHDRALPILGIFSILTLLVKSPIFLGSEFPTKGTLEEGVEDPIVFLPLTKQSDV